LKNGIAAGRLTAKGYGESQLVNDCGCEPTNKSNCTEEQHQANRRSGYYCIYAINLLKKNKNLKAILTWIAFFDTVQIIKNMG
jgi:hypothetical protein